MNDYYCKNCDTIVGKWNNTFKWHNNSDYCNRKESPKSDVIYFLDCINCNYFIGLECYKVCKICFGEDTLYDEKILFNWFQKYRKSKQTFYGTCKLCYEKTFKSQTYFRLQTWFFEELTVQKKQN